MACLSREMGSIGDRTGACISVDYGNSLNVWKSEQRGIIWVWGGCLSSSTYPTLPLRKTLSTSPRLSLSARPSAKVRLHLLQACVTPHRPTLTSACQVWTRPPLSQCGCQNHLWSSSRPYLRIVRLPKENRGRAVIIFLALLSISSPTYFKKKKGVISIPGSCRGAWVILTPPHVSWLAQFLKITIKCSLKSACWNFVREVSMGGSLKLPPHREISQFQGTDTILWADSLGGAGGIFLFPPVGPHIWLWKSTVILPLTE